MRWKHWLITMLLGLCVWSTIEQGEAACTAVQLQTELLTDPASLGYAPYVAVRNDAQLLTILNTVQPAAEYIVSKGLVTTESQRSVWGDVIQFISAISDSTSSEVLKEKEQKWDKSIQSLFVPWQTIDYSATATAGFFAQMVADQLQVSDGLGGMRDITMDDITARTTRAGSRAEVVCGSGTVLTIEEVSNALALP